MDNTSQANGYHLRQSFISEPVSSFRLNNTRSRNHFIDDRNHFAPEVDGRTHDRQNGLLRSALRNSSAQHSVREHPASFNNRTSFVLAPLRVLFPQHFTGIPITQLDSPGRPQSFATYRSPTPAGAEAVPPLSELLRSLGYEDAHENQLIDLRLSQTSQPTASRMVPPLLHNGVLTAAAQTVMRRAAADRSPSESVVHTASRVVHDPRDVSYTRESERFYCSGCREWRGHRSGRRWAYCNYCDRTWVVN
ncbi:hypothetical protein F5B22DRAFT_539094 [Xylaria bambusicola]|uniref:uncharacterized protein n=1 Tax=Xylaria bambusicola TaxID=326684 RepID=UPI00200873FA|nr:uncharacterized protein F5B22DRAFT_539094 [Xylaria bambusicola]KAI0521462.1 hypothetical protein F5B22DRAFT_539094 [Xylaria bambusicola]